MSATATPARSVYAQVTDRIVQALEHGTVPWERPWSVIGAPHNAATGHKYRGVNVLLTQTHALQHGHACSGYVTYLQAKQLGGHVRRGEQGVGLVLWKPVTKAPETEAGEEEEVSYYWYARSFTAFNLDQVAGLDHLRRPAARTADMAANPAAEAIIAASPAPIRWTGSSAFYSPETDSIMLPPRATFKSAAGLYSTAFHEEAHSTGAPHRLNRDLGGRFGSESYCVEELIAELTASFLCARVGIDHVGQSAAYVGAWLRVLKGDSRAVFTAARLASEAADFLARKA